MSEWQPIETAPKDGRLILGYDHSLLGWGVCVMRWEKREFPARNKKYGWRIIHAELYGDPIYDDLIYWAPIPDLPEVKGEGNERID
jgi:hypothetical protein